jgi:Tol biopolymer transport system component
MNGSSLVRLTAEPASDDGAAWSPDGATIAFSTTRYGADPQLATMRSDGSSVTQLGGGIIGWDPAWSPDGAYLSANSKRVHHAHASLRGPCRGTPTETS